MIEGSKFAFMVIIDFIYEVFVSRRNGSDSIYFMNHSQMLHLGKVFRRISSTTMAVR